MLPTTESQPLILTFWVSDPRLADFADKAGVDRIGVDLEIRGKLERQAGLNTWVSGHSEDDLRVVSRSLTRAQLFARTNPLHAGSPDEIDRLIDIGVEVLMLPMFKTAPELESYFRIVDGRAKVVPLLETVEAANNIEAILALGELDEIHIGINDLSLDLGLQNRFSLLTTDFLERLADRVLESGKRLGCGHVGRAMDESLPIPSDLVYAQYARLGIGATLVSKAFIREGMTEADFVEEIQRLRARMCYWSECSSQKMRNTRCTLQAVLDRLTTGYTNVEPRKRTSALVRSISGH